jgi:ribosomal protein L4
MSHRPTTAQTKEAFLALAMAIDHLIVAKERLANIYALSDEVDNSAFLVENHHRFASPDADTHDVLYARHEKAKAAVTALVHAGEIERLKEQITEATTLAQDAYKHL